MSFTPGQIDLSDFESDSDDDDDRASTYTDISEAFAKVSLKDVDESPDDDSSTFYEQSCRYHGDRGDEEDSDTPQDNRLLREGLQLNASFLQSIKACQRKEKNESFYEQPLQKEQCEHLLRLRPNQYKRCSLQIKGCHRAYCTPVKSEDKITTIEISGRSKAGRTFNEDEVVVEILDIEHEKEDKRYGKVIGVLNRERHKDVKHPVFVCTLDDMESHLVRQCVKQFQRFTSCVQKFSKGISINRRTKLKSMTIITEMEL